MVIKIPRLAQGQEPKAQEPQPLQKPQQPIGGNPFAASMLATLPQEPQQTAAPGNPYLAPTLAQLDEFDAPAAAQDRERRFMAAYRAAVRTDSATFGEATEIGKRLGVAPDLVAEDLTVARELVRARAVRYRELHARNPILTEALGNFDFARIAASDIDNLSATETTFGRLKLALDAGAGTNERGFLGLRKATGALSQAEADRLLELETLAQDSAADSGFLAAAGRIAGQMSGTVPVAVGVGAATSAVATPAAGIVAGGATTFSLSSMIASGNAYLDMVDRGIPHNVAIVAAFGEGVTAGALDTAATLVQAGPFLKAAGRIGGKVAAGAARGTGGSALGAFVKDYVASAGSEIVTELAQDVTGHGIEEIAAAMSPNAKPGTPLGERLAGTAEETFKGMSLLALPGPALRFAVDSMRARQSRTDAEFFDSLHKQAAASSTAKNAPTTFGEFVGKLGAQAGVDAVYVEGSKLADALRQGGIEPDQLAQHAPDVAAQLGPAVATGGDVVIPMDKYGAAIAGNPKLAAALLPHVRLEPEAMPAGEAEGFRQREQEDVAGIVKETEQRAASERQRRESARGVEDDYLAQLRATGRLRDDEARGVAVLLRSFVETRAQQSGMLPGEFSAQYPLVVKAAAEAADPGFGSARGDFHPDRGIRLFGKATVDTVLHEASHWFLAVSAKLAATPNAPAVVVEDVRAYLQTVGVESIEQWEAMTLDEQRKAHERFAYSFEQYAATGKAPSAELQGLFARFRSWLLRVYRDVRGKLNAAYRKETGEDLPILSPELRRFFDRMLASEDAIERAERVQQMVPMFDVQPPGMPDDAWQAYRAMHETVRDESIGDLTRAQTRWLLDARTRVEKELAKNVEGVREAVRQEIAPEVERQPVYRARRYLERGEMVDPDTGRVSVQQGGTHKLDTEAVRQSLPKGFDLRRLNITTPKGLSPDLLAGMFGFPTGEAMVKALASAPPLADAIEGATDARMRTEYSELVDPDSIEDAIAAALQTEARARFIGLEHRILSGAVQPVRLAQRAARLAAEQMLANTTLRALRPRMHTVAEARLGREAKNAFLRGDRQAATTAKRQQQTQIELARQSRALLDEVQKFERRSRDFFKPDATLAQSRNVDLIDAARSILAHFGLGEHDVAPSAYVERLRQYNPSLLAELQPIIDRATTNARALRDLTVDEFHVLRDAVEALWHQSRREMEMQVEGQRVQLTDVAIRLADRIREIGLPASVPGSDSAVTSRDEWVRDGMSAAATTTRVEHWARAMGSEFTKYVWRPVREALTGYRTSRNVEVKAYEELLRKHRDAGHLSTEQIQAPEIGYVFKGKAELLHAILHTGNESNLMKLLVGRGWGERRDDGTVNRGKWERFVARMVREGKLTEADFDFAQAVWDHLERIKPLLQATHRDLYGHYFKEVPPAPFGLFGKEYRGGYVPATADKFTAQSARLHDQMAELEGDFRNVVPSVPRGFTKSRDESARPLALDLRRLAGHLDDTLRFAHVQPAVRDVLRLLNHKELQPVLARFNPTAHEKLLLPFLQRAARGAMTEPGRNARADRFWNALRSNGGLAIMAGNVSNALQNITGLFTAMVQVKPRHVLAALFRKMGSPRAIAAEIAAESPFMADRSSKSIFDSLDGIRAFVSEPGLLGKAQEFSRKHGYVLQQLTQNLVDQITYVAARNQALEEIGPDAEPEAAHREAVKRAEAAVRMTQGSLEAEDVSAFEAGTPFWRALLQFQSWFNGWANLNGYEAQRLVRDLGWRRGAPHLFGLYVVGMMLPMTVAAAIGKTLAGTWDDEDDDGYSDEFADWFFGSQLKGAFASVPVVGQLGSLAWNVFGDGESWNDRMPLPASLSLIEQSAKAVRGLGNGATGREVRDVSTLLSLLFGVPVTVAGRPLGYALDVGAGNVKPTSDADYLRGLVTGRASEGSR